MNVHGEAPHGQADIHQAMFTRVGASYIFIDTSLIEIKDCVRSSRILAAIARYVLFLMLKSVCS